MFNFKCIHWSNIKKYHRASFLLYRTDFCVSINQQECQYKTLLNLSSIRNINACFKPLSSLFSVSTMKFEVPKPQNLESNSTHPPTGKIFLDFEAEYHHNILEKNNEYSESIYIMGSDFNDKYQLTDQEFQDMINADWESESKSASEIVTAFVSLATYSSLNLGLPISDSKFTNIVTAFASKCSQFSDDDLIDCMTALQIWPSSNHVKEENFLKTWKALDEAFTERIPEWTNNKILFMMDLWYHLKLFRLSMFTYKGLIKVSKRCDDLTKTQMVQTMFYFSCIRKLHPAISIREYEYYLQKHITHLTIEEIGIVALAFFKIKKNIINIKILSYIMNRVVDEVDTIHNMTLAAISKCLRFSHKPVIGFMANDFTKLVIDRRKDTLNIQTLVHLGHINTQVQFFNKDVITVLAEKFCNTPSEARLKDIERMALMLSLYNYIPPSTPDILNIIVEQLESMVHREAGKRHYLVQLSLLYFLSLLKVFPETCIRYVLSEDVMRSNYQKRYTFPMQIGQLEYNRVLEGPPGNKYLLDPALREYLARRHSEFAPSDGYPITNKFSAMFKEVIDCTDKLFEKDCYYITHILPHHPRPDILFRLDENRQPMPIPKEMRDQPVFDDVLYAPDPSGWHAVVIGGRNMYMQNEPRLVGEQAAKTRQLKLVGYTPIVIPAHYWNSEKDKLGYLKLKYFTPPT